MENIELGLLLMVVGMVTVFVILLIVIWLSQLLISIVNKVAPEEAPKKKVVATGASTDAGAMESWNRKKSNLVWFFVICGRVPENTSRE